MTMRFAVGNVAVARGSTKDIELPVSQSFRGHEITVPMRVIRATKPGPTLLLTGAVHGDELNGTGIVREILLHRLFTLERGSLILVPVVNVLGFDRQSRYLPDRRDLNRSFPGNESGSLASRIARTFFESVVKQADFIIDLHTGGGRRTNFPNLRADMSDPAVARLARAFGVEVVVDTKGTAGTMRRVASESGRPAVVLEAGEVLKVEPTVVEAGVRGVRNVLIEFGMIRGARVEPAFHACIERSTWIRSEVGGMLRLHVGPGDAVSEGAAIATVATLLGRVQGVLRAPAAGIVMGLTTLPSVKPGDPVIHLGIPREDTEGIQRAVAALLPESHFARLKRAFEGSAITEPSPDIESIDT